MSRITACFEALKTRRRKALIPYVTAGDPSPELTLELMQAMVRAGADVIELGVPFSDPMADGPVIQRAGERALRRGVRLRDVLGIVERFRTLDAETPVVLMGYANPIEAMGVTRFVEDAGRSGVDGVLVVDYPPEECEDFAAQLGTHGIDPIFMLAPTSTARRIAEVARVGRGYLYYVSLKGVTGAAFLDPAEVAHRVEAIRAETRLPVGVGFGIRDAESARRVAQSADAVIIGSRIVQEIEDAGEASAVTRVVEFLRSVRAALDTP